MGYVADAFATAKLRYINIMGLGGMWLYNILMQKIITNLLIMNVEMFAHMCHIVL